MEGPCLSVFVYCMGCGVRFVCELLAFVSPFDLLSTSFRMFDGLRGNGGGAFPFIMPASLATCFKYEGFGGTDGLPLELQLSGLISLANVA